MVHILIVEDDAAISNLIRSTLQGEGYQCTCALDGKTGADLLDSGRWDLVLLDLKIMDRELHRKYTGVYNDRILDNAEKMMKRRVRLHIRVPLMAGINDTEENADAMFAFVKE